MIDFVKIKVRDRRFAAQLLGDSLFRFIPGRDRKTNSLNGRMNAALIRGMGTHVKSDGETVAIEGSIHKFANNGLHNYDDFPRSRLVTTVEEMADLWGFDPRQARVHSLEFGANFRVEGTASAFVQNLVSHGTSPLAPMGKRAFQGVEDETFDRIFKVYDLSTGQKHSQVLKISVVKDYVLEVIQAVSKYAE